MAGFRRRQVTALILAGVFPGLGQLYNRQHLKGGAFFAAAVVLSWVAGREVPADLLALAHPPAALVLLLVTLLGIWIWSTIDAWLVAGWQGRPR